MASHITEEALCVGSSNRQSLKSLTRLVELEKEKVMDRAVL